MLCLSESGGVFSVAQIASGSACAGYLVPEATDIPPNPFYMSMADGAEVASAIVGVWLLAWSFKAIRSVLNDNGDGD